MAKHLCQPTLRHISQSSLRRHLSTLLKLSMFLKTRRQNHMYSVFPWIKAWKKKSENQWLQRFKYNHQLQQSCRKDTYCNFRYLCCVSLLLEIYSKSRRGRILIGKLQERHLKPQHFQWLNEFRVTCHSWVWVLSVWPFFPLLHCIIFCSTCFQIHDQGNFLPQLWLSGHGAVITNPPVIQKNCQAGKMQQHQY